MNTIEYPNTYDNYDLSQYFLFGGKHRHKHSHKQQDPGIVESILSDLLGCPPAKYFFYTALILVIIHILFSLVHGDFSISTICCMCCVCVCLFTLVVYVVCIGVEFFDVPPPLNNIIAAIVAIILAMIMCCSLL